MKYCIYLRKSRADLELEAYGEGETLARHERILRELAAKKGLPITKIYKEIVSGETIAARPVVQQLLSDVEQRLWDGVLVMEIERLGRGDTIDQGIIAQTFKFTDTQIITPVKTYNPNNEFDEEYFEFGLFMSRREYKTINRRLQQGRTASAQEGKWQGAAPYGYKTIKAPNGKGCVLTPLPQEAETVQMIFRFYNEGQTAADGSYREMGAQMIANELNRLHIPTRTGKPWCYSTVRGILQNPVYIGKIRWRHRPQTKTVQNGKVTVSRPQNSGCLLCNGLHKPLITAEQWQKAQKIFQSRRKGHITKKRITKNPLCGLVYCGICGKKMQRKPFNRQKNTAEALICPTAGCPNHGAALNNVEQKLLDFLTVWLQNYSINTAENLQDYIKNRQKQIAADIKNQTAALNKLQKEQNTLDKQLANIHDLLEQGVYSATTFGERLQITTQKKQNNIKSITYIKTQINILQQQKSKAPNPPPKIEQIAAIYSKLNTAEAKNRMLKELIEKIVYIRTVGGRHADPMNFSITVYPKLPKQS